MNPRDWDEAAASLRTSLLMAWEPRERLPVSVVAERHLYLSPEYSKEAGYVRFERYPYLREPADALGQEDPARVVVFRGPVQGGKTIIGQAFWVACVLQAPGPFIWVTDTDTKAEIFSKKRLDLMVRDDPTLRGMVADGKSRNKDNTIKYKTYPGGDIKLVGAQSVSGLTSDTCRYAMIDEADDHRANVSSAGSSIVLAMNRQTTYGDLAKTLIVSSPKVKGDSEIDAWHARGDQRVYKVPCLRCGEYQPLVWQEPDSQEFRLVWDKGDPSSARYVCAFCGAEWVDGDKNAFLPAGNWKATRPDLGEDGKIKSYGLSGLYLPTGSCSWPDLARQWESAVARLKADDTEELRTFVNTRLGASFDPPADSVDPRGLAAHESTWDDQALPAGVRAITFGADVHDDRIEVEFVGWGQGFESWSLLYAVLPTSPLDNETWVALDVLRRREYRTEDGRVMKAAAGCVDEGYLTEQVRSYCKARNKTRVYNVKGVHGRHRPIWDKKIHKAGRKKNLGRFWPVGTDDAKDKIAAYLRVGQEGPKYCHFKTGTTEDYYKGLTSEERFKSRDRRGREIWGWRKRKGAGRNEPLDCRVYALAALHSLMAQGFKLEPPLADDPPEPAEGQPQDGQQPPPETAPQQAGDHPPTEHDLRSPAKRTQPKSVAKREPWFGRTGPREPGRGWFDKGK